MGRHAKTPELSISYEDTDSLVPYAGNAKVHDEVDVAAIAESISRFGFSDPVGVWTNGAGEPEIVEGHGRVLAAKKLGIAHVPVVHLDHLTDEQRRAYTHIHNQTTMNSGFDNDLLAEEMAALPDFEWGDFGFDIGDIEIDVPDVDVPRDVMYGEERLRTDRAYNLHLVSVMDCGADGMPTIRAVDFRPSRLIGFNYAKTATDKACGVHFFVDDYQFERCWNQPEENLERLRGFECACTPDFSLYMDMPLPMQQWNVYRSRVLGHYWQREGLTVIPTLSWSTPDSYSFAFAGLEPGGTYAVSTVGVKGNAEALKVWRDGMTCAMSELMPKRILQYGGDIGFDYNGCEVVDYRNGVTERMRNGR